MLQTIICQNCGAPIQFDNEMVAVPRCNACGAEFTMVQVSTLQQQQQMMYQAQLRCRRKWRVIFVVLELLSFFMALGFCWAFATFLDTPVFKEQNGLIFVVWALFAIGIFRKLKPRIR